MRIAVRHDLVGLLGRGVQRQRVFGRLVLGERHPGVGAVYRAGRGEHQVLDAVLTATFEHMQEAGDVAADVDVRVLRGVAHAGLRGEVDHALRLVGREGGFHRRAVGQVGGDVGVVRMVDEAGQAGLLQADIRFRRGAIARPVVFVFLLVALLVVRKGGILPVANVEFYLNRNFQRTSVTDSETNDILYELSAEDAESWLRDCGGL